MFGFWLALKFTGSVKCIGVGLQKRGHVYFSILNYVLLSSSERVGVLNRGAQIQIFWGIDYRWLFFNKPYWPVPI